MAPNHIIQPTGASRLGQCQFAHQRRLAPAAHTRRWAQTTVRMFLKGLLLVLLVGPSACTKTDADSATCLRNLQEIGSASRVFELANKRMPADFRSLRPYLSQPQVLICPAYHRKPPRSWNDMDWAGVTYELVRPGLKLAETQSVVKVFARCPKHGYLCLGDGSVLKRPHCETVP